MKGIIKVSDIQHSILKTIASVQSPISSGEIARLLNIGLTTVKRHIDTLLNEGKIIRHGTGRGTRYTH